LGTPVPRPCATFFQEPAGLKKPLLRMGSSHSLKSHLLQRVFHLIISTLDAHSTRNKLMAKKSTPEKTSPSVASKASKLLSNPSTPKAVKSVAASALTQAANKTKKGK
jgi:hypothetical protein